MRSRRGSHGRFASLYGTTTLRLGIDFQYPLDGPRYELLVIRRLWAVDRPTERVVLAHARHRGGADPQHLPWLCGGRGSGSYPNISTRGMPRPDAVLEHTRLFLLDAGCALERDRDDGWLVQASNKSPICTNGLHLMIAALRNFYEVMRRRILDLDPHDASTIAESSARVHARNWLGWRSYANHDPDSSPRDSAHNRATS